MLPWQHEVNAVYRLTGKETSTRQFPGGQFDFSPRLLLPTHTWRFISEVDLLSAGGYSGYGKVLLFDPAHPHGLCLAW